MLEIQYLGIIKGEIMKAILLITGVSLLLSGCGSKEGTSDSAAKNQVAQSEKVESPIVSLGNGYREIKWGMSFKETREVTAKMFPKIRIPESLDERFPAEGESFSISLGGDIQLIISFYMDQCFKVVLFGRAKDIDDTVTVDALLASLESKFGPGKKGVDANNVVTRWNDGITFIELTTGLMIKEDGKLVFHNTLLPGVTYRSIEINNLFKQALLDQAAKTKADEDKKAKDTMDGVI